MQKLAATLGVGVLMALGCSKPVTEPGNPNSAPGAGDVKLTFTISTSVKQGQTIPLDFEGLSFETEELVHSDYFNAGNTTFVQLIKGLGNGVLRIGGGSADHTFWNLGKSGSTADSVWLTSSSIDRYFEFAGATGWRTMYTLNQGTAPIGQISAEAGYIQSKYATLLAGYEIGNEGDLYALNGLRSSTFTFEQYKNEWNDRYLAVKTAVPDARFSGPSTSGNAWVGAFTAKEHDRMVQITEHFYQLYIGGDTIVTTSGLLADNIRLLTQAGVMRYEGDQYSLAWRVNECSSVNGALSGVSNSLASAIWGLDFMYTLAEKGCAGVNFHGGGNQAHTPIADSNGMFYARPLYYGMLLFSKAVGGQILPVTAGPAQDFNLTAHAVKSTEGKTLITLINKDLSSQAYVTLYVGGNDSVSLQAAPLIRLTGPSPASQAGVKLGGAVANASGSWSASDVSEKPAIIGNLCTVKVPSCSAVMLTLQ